MTMKRLLTLSAALCSLTMTTPVALAADGLRPSQTVQSTVTQPNSSLTTTNTQSPSNVDEHGSGRDWSVRSSVQVTRDALREAYLASRDAYTNKLKKYAKCTPAAAKKAISAAHPGMKVEDVQLRNIRTSLVYVGVAEDEEDRYVVIVDAGNGKVLMDRPVPTHQERVFANGQR